MKRSIICACVLLGAASFAFADDNIQLIYPASAALEETLDSSTPQKRAVPPVKEDEELDPVTPLGQIRGVLRSLENVENAQKRLEEGLEELKTKPVANDRSTEILDALKGAKDERAALTKAAAALIESTGAVGRKIDDVATVVKTARAVDKTSKAANWGVFLLVGFFALVGVAKVGGAVVDKLKAARTARDEAIAARAFAAAEAKLAKTRQTQRTNS